MFCCASTHASFHPRHHTGCECATLVSLHPSTSSVLDSLWERHVLPPLCFAVLITVALAL